MEPNAHIGSIIAASTMDSENMRHDFSNAPMPRTELDSHANTVVLSKHAFIFDGIQSKTCDVHPYDPSIGKATKVPIVDGAVAYDCPYTNETHIFCSSTMPYTYQILITTWYHRL